MQDLLAGLEDFVLSDLDGAYAATQGCPRIVEIGERKTLFGGARRSCIDARSHGRNLK